MLRARQSGSPFSRCIASAYPIGGQLFGVRVPRATEALDGLTGVLLDMACARNWAIAQYSAWRLRMDQMDRKALAARAEDIVRQGQALALAGRA